MGTRIRLTFSTATVLYALSRGIRYGFDIIDATALQSGTVYPVLRRLEESGMVRSQWEPAHAARDAQRPPRRYYELTGSGAEAVRDALDRFPALRHAVGRADGAGAPRPA